MHTLGILLPEWVLATGGFAILSAFVAINTVMYVALSVAKMLPKLYPSDWLNRGGRNRRAQARDIYPPGWEPAATSEAERRGG